MKSINTAAILLVLTVVPLSGVALKTNSMYHPDKKKNCIIGCNPESAFFAQALNISDMSFIMLDAYGRMYGLYDYADIRVIEGKLHLLIGANGSFYFCEME